MNNGLAEPPFEKMGGTGILIPVLKVSMGLQGLRYSKSSPNSRMVSLQGVLGIVSLQYSVAQRNIIHVSITTITFVSHQFLLISKQESS